MSVMMEEEIKRWMARRMSTLALETIQTTASEASRQFDLAPLEIREWMKHANKAGMDNALQAKPEDVREQCERQPKELQEAYGESMLELRAQDRSWSLPGKDEN